MESAFAVSSQLCEDGAGDWSFTEQVEQARILRMPPIPWPSLSRVGRKAGAGCAWPAFAVFSHAQRPVEQTTQVQPVNTGTTTTTAARIAALPPTAHTNTVSLHRHPRCTQVVSQYYIFYQPTTSPSGPAYPASGFNPTPNNQAKVSSHPSKGTVNAPTQPNLTQPIPSQQSQPAKARALPEKQARQLTDCCPIPNPPSEAKIPLTSPPRRGEVGKTPNTIPLSSPKTTLMPKP